jgi:hypothetical protein
VGDDFSTPGDGIDTIDGGPDHDTLNLLGSTGFDDGTGKGFGATITSARSSWTARSPA